MNKGLPTIKTWLLTHRLSVWGEGILFGLFFAIAASIVWESQ